MSEMSKQNALKENVSFWLYKFYNGKANSYDPKNVADLFSRSKAIFDKLRSEKPSYFADLPVRDEKPSETGDWEGRGLFYRHQLERLFSDLDYCTRVLSGLISVGIPSMTLTREGIFFAGQLFDALQRVGEILSNQHYACQRRQMVIRNGYKMSRVA